MPLGAGRRLGPYEVVSSIGAGGMGEVYRARDTRLGRDVALKVLPADRSNDPDRLRRFEREARAVAALEHPHILALHDVGSEDGVSYVVFELLEGQTLRQKLEEGPLPVRKSVEWGVQVCRGLAAAHARGIVHRDLKPENLCLTADGRIKILDFGLARATAPLDAAGGEDAETRTATDAGFVVGTVGYMSPEQVRGQAADARSDLFSVGAVLYEMLTGRRAFQAATPADTISAILHHDPPEIGSGPGPVPAGLDRVVRRCLEKDPDERFQTARDLAFALENQSGTSSAGAVAPAPPSGRRGLRAGAALLTLLPVAAGIYFWDSRRPLPLTDFTQLTFRSGMIVSARFTADGNTVAYSGIFDGNPSETYSMRLDRPESQPLGLPAARLVGLSSAGEAAVVLSNRRDKGYIWNGTLARVPLSGGAPREILEDVWWADWSPDGKELAVVHRVDGDAQLEYPIGRILLRPFPLNYSGFALRVSPHGDRVAFTNPGSGILVVDRAGTPLGLGADLDNVGGLAWDPGGDAVWVTARGGVSSRSLWRLGLDGTVREAVRLPGSMMILDVSRDGRALIHVGTGREGIRARAPGETFERDLCPYISCYVHYLTPDGRGILMGDNSESAKGRPTTLFLRPTTGGPAVRLGEGVPVGLSPDARSVLSVRSGLQQVLELVPMGPGAPKTINTEGLQDLGGAWFLDATHILLFAAKVLPSPVGRSRMYRVDLDGTPPIPFTPEGVFAIEGSLREGSVLGVAVDEGTLAWYPLAGGEPRPISARSPPGTWVIRMSADQRYLFVSKGGVPGRIERLELGTGRRLPWRTLWPDEPAGVVDTLVVSVTPDGSAYAYSYLKLLQDLYLVEGVR